MPTAETMTFAYPVEIERDDTGRFVASFPDLPGAATDGESLEEALAEAVDCLDEAIAMRIDDKLQIPRPSKARRDQPVLSVPAQTAAKAALYLAMLSAGVGPRELARRMGCDPKEAMRLLDPRYPSKIGRLQEAIRLANGEVTLSFRHAS